MLAAFGADAPPTPLEGGQGTAWRAGAVVLKPLDRRPEELAYEARLLARVRQDGFRPGPPPARRERRVGRGWLARHGVRPGRHEPGRWLDVVEAGELLHAALREEERPALLDRRRDRWAIADRVAFAELDPPVRDPLVDRLLDARGPLRAPSQLVHGDLTGNVLFAEGLPPAILDLSLYFRPVGFATAVVLADALVFEGAGEGRWPGSPRDELGQLAGASAALSAGDRPARPSGRAGRAVPTRPPSSSRCGSRHAADLVQAGVERLVSVPAPPDTVSATPSRPWITSPPASPSKKSMTGPPSRVSSAASPRWTFWPLPPIRWSLPLPPISCRLPA